MTDKRPYTDKELKAELDEMLTEGLIRRVGSGTPGDPYRYYRTEAGTRWATQKMFQRLYNDG